MNDTLVQWIVGGGLVTILTAWGSIRVERWRAKREEKADESARYDALWAKLEKMNTEAEQDRDEYRKKFAESEQLRLHEGEACEKRIREARREGQTETDEVRKDLRGLSVLCHKQQLELDSSKNEISSLKAHLAAIPGGRRATDPPPP